jgi:hypothetical protein
MLGRVFWGLIVDVFFLGECFGQEWDGTRGLLQVMSTFEVRSLEGMIHKSRATKEGRKEGSWEESLILLLVCDVNEFSCDFGASSLQSGTDGRLLDTCMLILV